MPRRKPKLCRHKGRDLAYVTVNGRERYLGKWGSPEAAEPCDAEVRKWRRETDQSRHSRPPSGS